MGRGVPLRCLTAGTGPPGNPPFPDPPLSPHLRRRSIVPPTSVKGALSARAALRRTARRQGVAKVKKRLNEFNRFSTFALSAPLTQLPPAHRGPAAARRSRARRG